MGLDTTNERLREVKSERDAAREKLSHVNARLYEAEREREALKLVHASAEREIQNLHDEGLSDSDAIDALQAQLVTSEAISDTFWEALKPLKLAAIHVENPGQHITDLIAERDALLEQMPEDGKLWVGPRLIDVPKLLERYDALDAEHATLRSQLAACETERHDWKMLAEHRAEMVHSVDARLAALQVERDNASMDFCAADEKLHALQSRLAALAVREPSEAELRRIMFGLFTHMSKDGDGQFDLRVVRVVFNRVRDALLATERYVLPCGHPGWDADKCGECGWVRTVKEPRCNHAQGHCLADIGRDCTDPRSATKDGK